MILLSALCGNAANASIQNSNLSKEITSPELAKGLVEDAIRDLKSNDIKKAQLHLSILNQQLPILDNPTSLESVKLLLEDVTLALKNSSINNALLHLNLIKQPAILDWCIFLYMTY